MITDAHIEIGATAEGEVLTADQAAFGLRTLNRLIDANQERLSLYALTRTVVPLVADQQDYLLGGVDSIGAGYEDGFDTEWVGEPPPWTAATTGTAVIANDTTPTEWQAGGHSVGMFANSTLGSGTLYRDFIATSGGVARISVWLYSSLPLIGTGGVTVQNLTTGNYVNSDGQWGSASVLLFDIAGVTPLTFEQSSVAINVESATDVGAATCLLRVTFKRAGTGVIGAMACFDTFSFNSFTDIQKPRPQYIDHVNLILTNSTPNTEIPLQSLTQDGRALMPQWSLTSTQPTSYFWNPTVADGTLSVWPIPDNSTYSLAVYYPTQLTGYSGLDTDLVLPPGYEEMYVSNLAVRLCPSFSVNPPAALVEAARSSMAMVKRANYKMSDMGFPGGASIGGSRYGWGWNIRTGP